MNWGVSFVATEAQLQAAVARIAVRDYSLLHYHTHDSRRSDAGFLDSVFVGRRVLFRELKINRKSPVRPQQKVWLQRLTEAGADAKIWYVEDYHSGLIDNELAAIAPAEDVRPVVAEPPLAMRLAKRLYLASEATNTGRAALFWEAGVASVDHMGWIAQARQILALVADELPVTASECERWLNTHQLADLSPAAILSALRTDLTAPVAGKPATGWP